MRVGRGIRGQSTDGWRLAAAPRSCLAAQPSLYLALGRRSVAQPGRALLSGGRGRRFKSSHSDQIFSSKSVVIGRFSRWRCAAAKGGTLREPAAYIGTSWTRDVVAAPGSFMVGRADPAAIFARVFRARIRAARRARVLSQADVARALGISRSAYARYETRTSLPHHLIEDFVELTGADFHELLSAVAEK